MIGYRQRDGEKMKKIQRYLIYNLLMSLVFCLLSLILLLKREIFMGALGMIGGISIFIQLWRIRKAFKDVKYPTDKKPF